ncbi:MAG: class IV adenylate cyclase [Deltaproteobacteria bacterium]|nr:class IV adenylate cyclase [Deltaproteobacteria bacterium]
MRNIEIKIKLESDRKVKSILKGMAAKFEGEFIERDTFYHCPNGRLKLREIDGKFFKLIFYTRPDVAGSKTSEYWTVALDGTQALAMKMMLGDALGKQILVIKKRKLWLYENTRIHIDRVDGLSGVFLELETAVDEIGRKAAREEHARIIGLLGIGLYIPLSASYADMILDKE